MHLARLTPLLLLLCACGPKLVEDEVDGLRRLMGTIKASGDGQRPLKFEPLPGETAMLLTSVPTDGDRTHVVLVERDGAVVFDAVEEATGDRATTNAGYLSFAATLNWPRSAAESLGPLEVLVGKVGGDSRYANGELQITALFKKDADFSAGTVKVVLVYAGGARGDANLEAAMVQAVAHWRDLYAQVGLELDVSESSWPEGDLEAPVHGTDDRFAQIAEAVGPNTLNVVIAPLIKDVEDVLGVAGDIPGPLTATSRSGVLVSSVTSAGPDGVFNAEETRILGETLAHEAGHYLGLFHPVESTWARWDALDDTAECTNENPCITALGDHLMFPFPVCSFSSCVSQEVISEEQGGVMHRYTGVD